MNKAGWNLENTYTRLPSSLFTKMELNPVKSPELILLNTELAGELDLNSDYLKEEVEVFAGNKLPTGSIPIAKAYAGHQFGYFSILGDGRALLLGEQVTKDNKRFDIELKGSGRTPYSRGGDGRASIGPMLREYIISEAMYRLGIPTTRSLAVVTTGEKIRRRTLERGAILTRVASSHLRVGTFELVASRGNDEHLRELADYAIKRHFDYIKDEENKYLSLLKEVIKKQAILIAKWQLVGFIHGVMNTDNMTISGETIDYGPCAFMDIYDPDTVFSSIDREGRYAYKNQPNIGAWNLTRFAETLIPLIDEDREKSIEMCKNELDKFSELYNSNYLDGMRKKLGIFNKQDEDAVLIGNLLTLMYQYKEDYTNIFRSLSIDKCENTDMFNSVEFKEWIKIWKNRLEKQEETFEESKDLMKKNNPSAIPRNYKVENALKAAEDLKDYELTHELLDVLKDPFQYSDKYKEYYRSPPETNIAYKTYCGT